MKQLLLFDPDTLPPAHKAFLGCYLDNLSLDNASAYEAQARNEGIPLSDFKARVPIGKSSEQHSPAARRVRWWQQDLKAKGWLEPVPNMRGRWRLTEPARKALTPATPKRVLLACSTDLGVALWASCEDVFGRLNEPISLILSSPPFPLARPRAYGNPSLTDYVDWLCQMVEPIIRNLVDGGVVALNVSNDIFEPNSPARSTYREELVIALCRRFSLFKFDEIIWSNPSKPPGPIQWASRTRQQLNTAWEPVYLLTNNPHRCLADNRRVLEPHTDNHMALIKRGGERRTGVYSDGAYQIKPGCFGRPTAGKIPRNVLEVPHLSGSAEMRKLRALMKAEGIPVHGATMPLPLAEFLVNYLCPPGGVTVDPFGGWGTTAMAAEKTGRRWIITEKYLEYAYGTSCRFALHQGSAPTANS